MSHLDRAGVDVHLPVITVSEVQVYLCVDVHRVKLVGLLWEITPLSSSMVRLPFSWNVNEDELYENESGEQVPWVACEASTMSACGFSFKFEQSPP